MPFLRALKQKFGIAAPRVAVRAHVPWYWRGLGFIAVATAAVAGALAAYDSALLSSLIGGDAAERKLARLNHALQSKDKEMARLRGQAVSAERQLAMERAASSDLARQVKALTEENAGLKEDLAFFQTVMPAGTRGEALTINRFKVTQEVLPGEYRYRLLLVKMGERDTPFEGRFQLVVDLVQNGRDNVITLPGPDDAGAKEYQLKFRSFQRLEGTFKVAPDAVVKSLQARIFEKGAKTPKLAQTVKMF